MTGAWQSCQGDYKPLDLFVRGNQTVITRNIKKVEDGLYQWEEYAMLTEDYEAVNAVVASSAPYTETKTAYIDDTFIVFTNVPSGNLTVYFDKPYTVEREADRVTVKFEALEEVTPITISII